MWIHHEPQPKPFTAEDAEDAEEAKVSLCVSDLALFQFLKTFSVAKAGYGRMQKQHENLCRKTRVLDIAMQKGAKEAR
ncbi:MAG: hypothetical protein DMG65_27045 [Candidatus Angelobacter sp. Gp1-AA117]|nr:MAG: hypothetical protein DMG65_27045 [Candidatus Angelobacter sp. Gp1-AA117]